MKKKSILLSEKQIKDIADELDTGMNAYIHRRTGKMISLPNEEMMAYGDTEFWEDDIQEIEENGYDYIGIEGMSSTESFRVMEDFVNEVDDLSLRDKLVNALKRNKPFRNFKDVIDFSEYRQAWFAYKDERLVQYVKDQLYLEEEE